MKTPTTIAAEAADRHLKWLYPNDKPKFGLERKHLITEIQAAIEKANVELNGKYYELIYAVSHKFVNESLHATALRYILQAESNQSRAAQAGETVKHVGTLSQERMKELIEETGVGGYEKARLEVMDDHYAVIIGGTRFRTEGKTEQDLQAAERLIAVTRAAQAEMLQGIIDQLRNNAREIRNEIKDLTNLVKSHASRSDAGKNL